jgi:hypothetical protein
MTAGNGRVELDRRAVREEHRSLAKAVCVEVDQPPQRSVLAVLGVVSAGLVLGIQADDVVHPIAARDVLLDELQPNTSRNFKS